MLKVADGLSLEQENHQEMR